MDALQSFTYLVDNIPQWLVRLDDLQAQCEIQYESFTKLTQRGEVRLNRRKKQASTESLRPAKNEEIATPLPQQQDVFKPPDPTTDFLASQSPELPSSQPTNVAIAQGIPRKRRAGSELSLAPSHQNRYRSRHMVIVYYDSEVQDAFEAIVKNIAAARNNLRKGRNAMTVKLRMAKINAQAYSLEKSSDRMEGLALDPKMMLGPGMSRARSIKQPISGEFRCFEDADKYLEQAQSLCERGAHQFLRDGDCFSEIETTRKRVSDCAAVAQSEVERLKQEAQIAQDDTSEGGEAEERTLVGDATPPTDQGEAKDFDTPSSAGTDPPGIKELKFAGAGAIEIDDGSDAESVEIDMNAVRRTVRSTRA